MTDAPVYDVAIVGFGPSGAVAAALLGQQGLRVHVSEQLTDIYPIPRAIALDHEIMRIFQSLGLIDAISPHTEAFTPSEYYGVQGQLIRRMTMVDPPYPQGYTPSLVFTQPPVEHALRSRVAQMPQVTVELGVQMMGLIQDDSGVTLTLQQDTTTRSVRARYVIACDGGASGVRTQLDMPLEDLDFDEPWLVVDVRVNEQGLAKLPPMSVQYCEPERPCTLVIGPKNHRRWEISLHPHEDPVEAATPAATWKLLSRWLTPEDGQLWRQSSYRFHALVARQWRAQRVFLAGDAAHMQPPFLGQGMCQGLRDVTNLAWKLGAVLRGQVQGAASERLLDSYGLERQAHVRELIHRIKGLGAVICERDPVKAQARDARLLAECGGVVRDTPRQDILPRLEIGLLSQQTHGARGTLFPQPLLESVQGPVLLDARVGTGWRLVLAPQHTPVDVPASAQTLALTVVHLGSPGLVETQGVALHWFQRYGCTAALVRPDHYVYGVASSRAQVSDLVRELEQALGF